MSHSQAQDDVTHEDGSLQMSKGKSRLDDAQDFDSAGNEGLWGFQGDYHVRNVGPCPRHHHNGPPSSKFPISSVDPPVYAVSNTMALEFGDYGLGQFEYEPTGSTSPGPTHSISLSSGQYPQNDHEASSSTQFSDVHSFSFDTSTDASFLQTTGSNFSFSSESHPAEGLHSPSHFANRLNEDFRLSSLVHAPSLSQPVQDVEMSDSDVAMAAPPPALNLTIDQDELFHHYRARWETQNHRPTPSEIQALASLEQLDPELIQAWFDINLVLPAPRQSEDTGMNRNAELIQSITEYVANKNNHYCGANGNAKKARSDNQYRCPWCPFSSAKPDAWKRHVLTKFPQDFWHCILCREADTKPFICSRPDKYLSHMKDMHGVGDVATATAQRDRSKVPYSAPFPSVCPFSNDNGPCKVNIRSWREFLEHCLEHFRFRIADGPWNLRSTSRQPRPDDDDGDNTDPSSSSNSQWSSQNVFQQWTNLSLEPYSSESRRYAGGKSSYYDERNSKSTIESKQVYKTRSPTLTTLAAQWTKTGDNPGAPRIPTLLIDVNDHCIVDAPANPKYLALDYTWASQLCPHLRNQALTPERTANSDILTHRGMPSFFREAVATTRDMGYRYLWIDTLCQHEVDQSKTQAVMQYATLIIVAFGSSLSSECMWFYTCHFENLRTVFSWATVGHPAQSFSHVQNLGHGTYGIVDEVRLRSTRQSFARKVYRTWKAGNEEQLTHQQEIELLGKFNHPNIPRFVAAYIEKRSLNMLMLPVADCNLKDFLAEPSCWPRKRRFVHQWFHSLASAVAYMHSLSCRHKDIKPANILVSGKDVLLSDFGIARDFSADESASIDRGLMTPKYCAPETALRQRRGRKADVFSLGCVFAEIITVELDVPLEDLDDHLKSKSTQPSNRRLVYWQNINSLKTWLTKLQLRIRNSLQRTVLNTCLRMLDPEPTNRPTAADIVNVLVLGVNALQRPKMKICMTTPGYDPLTEARSANSPDNIHRVEVLRLSQTYASHRNGSCWIFKASFQMSHWRFAQHIHDSFRTYQSFCRTSYGLVSGNGHSFLLSFLAVLPSAVQLSTDLGAYLERGFLIYGSPFSTQGGPTCLRHDSVDLRLCSSRYNGEHYPNSGCSIKFQGAISESSEVLPIHNSSGAFLQTLRRTETTYDAPESGLVGQRSRHVGCQFQQVVSRLILKARCLTAFHTLSLSDQQDIESHNQPTHALVSTNGNAILTAIEQDDFSSSQQHKVRNEGCALEMCSEDISIPDETLDEHLIEVGDLGYITMSAIASALSRHSRCTCHQRIMSNGLQGPADFASALGDDRNVQIPMILSTNAVDISGLTSVALEV